MIEDLKDSDVIVYVHISRRGKSPVKTKGLNNDDIDDETAVKLISKTTADS